jgi:hypothetical protein
VSREEPDVLVFGYGRTELYEIKMSLSDFNADKYKECRKKFKTHYYLQVMERMINDSIAEHIINKNDRIKRQFLKIKNPRSRAPGYFKIVV